MLGLFRRSTSGLLDELERSYGLEYVEADTTLINQSAAPRWWQGHLGTTRFGIRPLGKRWEVYLGTIVPLIDLELTRVGTRGTRPVEEIRLERFVPAGSPLASGWVASMIAHLDARFHGPQLAEPDVASSLAALGEAVRTVALYRSGVELAVVAADWDRAAFDSDVSRAARIVRALERYAARNPPPARPG